MSEAAKPAPANSERAAAVVAAKKKKRNNSLLRCLNRARDIYVNTFCGCAGGGGGSGRHGGGGRFTAGVAVLMPRARSRSAFGQSSRLGDDDFVDLVRANSKKNAAAAEAVTVVARSQSTAPAIGRIDEERSVEFEGDVKPGMGSRSQSCTVVAGGKMARGRA